MLEHGDFMRNCCFEVLPLVPVTWDQHLWNPHRISFWMWPEFRALGPAVFEISSTKDRKVPNLNNSAYVIWPCFLQQRAPVCAKTCTHFVHIPNTCSHHVLVSGLAAKPTCEFQEAGTQCAQTLQNVYCGAPGLLWWPWVYLGLHQTIRGYWGF